MNKEKVDCFAIKNIRRSLKCMDLLGINTDQLYKYYYKFILIRLNNVLCKAWIEFQKEMDKNRPMVSSDKVWIMWWQGYEQAPLIIKSNINNFNRLFGKKAILVTKDNFINYTDIDNSIIRRFKSGDISFTQWSDIVRYNLLKNNGGLWIDSSVIISDKFLTLEEPFTADYFSLCSNPSTAKFISLGRWTGWCIGGKSNYDLFLFMDIFFKIYYHYYNRTIDYFFADDAIAFFYNKSIKFRNIVRYESKEWDPYIFIRNFKSKNNSKFINQFKTEQKFCVQKLTYKFDFDSVDNNTLAKKLELGEI